MRPAKERERMANAYEMARARTAAARVARDAAEARYALPTHTHADLVAYNVACEEWHTASAEQSRIGLATVRECSDAAIVRARIAGVL